MKRIVILVLALAFLGCKSPEARYPVSHKSGSFIKTSAERNKKLNAAEYARIQEIIQSKGQWDWGLCDMLELYIYCA